MPQPQPGSLRHRAASAESPSVRVGVPVSVAEAHALLVRKGHLDPIVGVASPDGREIVGDAALPGEIGSVTKIFTGLLLAALVDDGLLRHGDRVGALLPAGTPLAPGVAGITLEQLASHRSGLPRLPPGMLARGLSPTASRDPYADWDSARLVASLARTRLRGRSGEHPVRYSNYGAGLLGHLLGAATGLGYRAALRTRVLAPLGLTQTTFDDEPLRAGHHRSRPVAPWHLAALAGAGGLHASAGDLLDFLEAVRDGRGPLAGPIADTLRPRSTGRPQVGLGWFMLGGGDLLMHDGGTLGSRCEVRVERHSGRCVAVLGDGRGGTARAAAMLLDPLPGRRR